MPSSLGSVAIDRRRKDVVKDAVDANGRFYTVLKDPIPTKTCFDVSMSTYSQPSIEYLITVKVPKRFPFEPPTVEIKKPRVSQKDFRFLEKDCWKPTMSIRTVLVEICHVLSQRQLKPRRRQRSSGSITRSMRTAEAH